MFEGFFIGDLSGSIGIANIFVRRRCWHHHKIYVQPVSAAAGVFHRQHQLLLICIYADVRAFSPASNFFNTLEINPA